MPYFQPYWALGFQLCRWGYDHIDVVKSILAEMREYDIPQVQQIIKTTYSTCAIKYIRYTCIYHYGLFI